MISFWWPWLNFQGNSSRKTEYLSARQLWVLMAYGGAKVSCILRHWGVQLILAYSWARPSILVAGKSRGGMFLFLLFLHFHSSSSFFPVPLFHLFYYLFYLFSPFLWETTQNDATRVDVSLNPNTVSWHIMCRARKWPLYLYTYKNKEGLDQLS